MTFGLVAAYLFGREFTDGTAKTMFTLPMRREYVVLAKMVVLALWVFGLGMLSVLLMMGVTALLGAGRVRLDARVRRTSRDTLGVCALFYVTLPFVAWFAMLGKGYLRPMLFSVAASMMQNALVADARVALGAVEHAGAPHRRVVVPRPAVEPGARLVGGRGRSSEWWGSPR